jgi:hypothetical protein
MKSESNHPAINPEIMLKAKFKNIMLDLDTLEAWQLNEQINDNKYSVSKGNKSRKPHDRVHNLEKWKK